MWLNTRAVSLLFVVVVAHAQLVVDPLPTPVATSVPTTTPVSTPVATSVPTTTPVSTPLPTVTSSPPPAAQSPPAIPTPPPSPTPPSPPPPPPGAGSSKTAVLSVIGMSGEDLQPFNATLGYQFVAGLAEVFGVQGGSILIRDWQTSKRRRLLADSVSVTSAAIFGDGMSAAAAVNTLNAADQSGELQSALQAAGLKVERVSVSSAATTLPSNFQPISSGVGGSRLSLISIIFIALGGTVVLALLAFCCCRRCFFCCPPREEEERLPNMIKYGAGGDRVAFFYNEQKFKKSPGVTGKKPLEASSSTAPQPICQNVKPANKLTSADNKGQGGGVGRHRAGGYSQSSSAKPELMKIVVAPPEQ